MGIRSRDHLWQLSLVGLAALVVAVVGVLLLRGDGRDQTPTLGQLTASDQGLATPVVAGPSAENDRGSGGEQRSVGAIADSNDDRSTARRTLMADATSTSAVARTTTTVTTTTGETATTKDTGKETTTTKAPTTTAPTTTAPPTTEPSTTSEPTVTITMPPITEPTVTLPTITIPLPPPPEHSITPEDLQAARDRFASTGYTSYGMTVRRSCFCLPEFIGPFDVVVRNGEIVSISDAGGFERDRIPIDEKTLTVLGLFDYIEEGFESDRMDVEFDKQTGVPRSISIDRIFGAVDDEITITVSNFLPHR